MVAKRIIPCLDVKGGRTVKGINFEGLRDVGDAVELGSYYARSGADEVPRARSAEPSRALWSVLPTR